MKRRDFLGTVVATGLLSSISLKAEAIKSDGPPLTKLQQYLLFSEPKHKLEKFIGFYELGDIKIKSLPVFEVTKTDTQIIWKIDSVIVADSSFQPTHMGLLTQNHREVFKGRIDIGTLFIGDTLKGTLTLIRELKK